MRSRFSAFAVGDAAYLLATWHPSTRPATLDLESELEWRRLEILDATDGGDGDQTGTVEFAAHFWDGRDGQLGLQREHSAFRRRGGQWYYVGVADEGPLGHR